VLPPGGKYRSYYISEIHTEILEAVKKKLQLDNNSEAMRTALEAILPTATRKKLTNGTALTSKEWKQALKNLKV